MAISLPSALCALQLNLDLWGDEAYTLIHFAAQPVAGILTDYSAPNNHILFTLLVRPFYLISPDPFVVRLPGLAISLGTLAATFALACRLAGRAAAVWTTLILGLNVMFLVHTMQVRGYGLSMLLVALLANLALGWSNGFVGEELTFDAKRKKSFFHAEGDSKGRGTSTTDRSSLGRGAAALVTLLGAAFLYTLPTNALFLAPLTLWVAWLAWHRGQRRLACARAIAPWVAGWLLALILYWPIARQLAAHGGSGRASLAQVARLGIDLFWAAGHDLWPLWLALPWAIIAWRRSSGAQCRRHSLIASLLGAMTVGPLVLAAMAGMTPFLRNFCPMLPFAALATAWVVGSALQPIHGNSATPAPQRRAMLIAGLIVALLLPAILAYPARLRRHRQEQFAQDGYYNYYAADFQPSCIAQFLRGQVDPAGTYRICYADADHYNLVLPLARAGFPIPPHHVAPTGAGYIYVVLPPRPDYASIEQRCGLTAAQIAEYPVVKRCGYYELRRSPTMWRSR